MGRAVRVLLGLIVLGGFGTAEPRLQNETGGLTISGTVRVPGNRNPFPGATVRLGTGTPLARPRVEDQLVTTDSQGHFSFVGLLPGRYQLTPISPRQDLIGAFWTTIELNEDAPPLNVELWLPEFSMVSGRVRGPEGEPFPDALVRVGHLEWFWGQRVLAVVPRDVRTDEAGEFSLPVPPGEYRLQVIPPDRQAFPPHYYPNAVRPEDAIPFRVAGGADLFGMDVTLTDTEEYRVRFRLPLSSALSGLYASLGTDDLPLRAAVRFLGPGLRKREIELHPLEALGDDAYQTGRLPSGDYEILLQYSTPVALLRRLDALPPGLDVRRLNPVARLPITLEDEDLDLGTLEPGVYTDVSGRIAVRQPAGPIDLATLPRLQFTDPTVGVTRYAFATADGTFLLERMPPGIFVLFPVIFPEEWPDGWYIVSAMRGGRDILRDGLLVGGQSDPIDIVIADDAAVISGVARDDSGDLIPGARIVLVPPAIRRGPPARYPTTVADDSGGFTVRNVPPGDYTFLALDLAGREATQLVPTSGVYHYWEDPEFVRLWVPRGERITVAPGARMVINPETVLLSD